MHEKEAEVELFRSGQQQAEAEVVEQAAESEAELAALKAALEEQLSESITANVVLEAQFGELQETLAAEREQRENALEREVEAKVTSSMFCNIYVVIVVCDLFVLRNKNCKFEKQMTWKQKCCKSRWRQ